MKYRKCLWCGDYFWAFGVEKCCCEEHRKARAAEKDKLAAIKRNAREEKIRAKLITELRARGGSSMIDWGELAVITVFAVCAAYIALWLWNGGK